MLRDFQKLVGDKPVAVIRPADYAMANAEKVFEFAEAVLKGEI